MRHFIYVWCAVMMYVNSVHLSLQRMQNLERVSHLSSVPTLGRSKSSRAPCEKDDILCWCEKAKDYTNDVRRRNGVKKMLKLGPAKQQKNANRYAEVLSRRGVLNIKSYPRLHEK